MTADFCASLVLMTQPTPATSAQIPVAPAPVETPTQPACARHPNVDGTRHCQTCERTLCSACSAYAPHQRCPSCLTDASLPPWSVRQTWLWTLMLDSAVTALPRLHKSALPFIALLWAVTQTRLISTEFAPLIGPVSWLGSVVLTALLLGSMGTGIRGVPGPGRRVYLALCTLLAGVLLVGVPVVLVVTVAYSDSVGHTARDGWALMTLGLVMMVPVALLFCTLSIAEAAAALLGRSPFKALWLPFSAGVQTWLRVFLGTAVAMAVMSPLGMLRVVDQGILTALASSLGMCINLFVQSAVAVACLRFILDARAARGQA